MKKLAVIMLSGVMLTPVFAQTGAIKIHVLTGKPFNWYGSSVFSGSAPPLSATITPLIDTGSWAVEVTDLDPYPGIIIWVTATNLPPMDPPGAQNVKVAEVIVWDGSQYPLPPQEVFRCDVVVDPPYYFRATTGSVGGSVGGYILVHSLSDFPHYPDGSYVPQQLVDVQDVQCGPAYEFVGWAGDPVDRGYVQYPTSTAPLMVTPQYHVDVGKQFFVKGLFGVPTAPGDTVVPLPYTPVTLGFTEIVAGGHTMLTKSATGPSVPTRSRLGRPPQYYDITTTATYSGLVSVCISYAGIKFTGSANSLRLLHYEGGQWVDCTVNVDTAAQVICGEVDSLSPFVIVELVTIPVEIDIKPGSYPNSININGHGVIPVAILGSDDFDVTRIDPLSLSLEGMTVQIKKNGRPQCSVEDVNADGYSDLVCQFADNGILPPPGTVSMTLTGNLTEEYDAIPIEGSDEIRIVP